VLIPHDGDGGTRGSGVYEDHQVEPSVHKGVRGVEIGLFDVGLGKERPERPVGLLYFETKPDRVTLTVNLLLNGVSFSNGLFLLRLSRGKRKDYT
jgi:hypothetical protein